VYTLWPGIRPYALNYKALREVFSKFVKFFRGYKAVSQIFVKFLEGYRVQSPLRNDRTIPTLNKKML